MGLEVIVFDAIFCGSAFLTALSLRCHDSSSLRLVTSVGQVHQYMGLWVKLKAMRTRRWGTPVQALHMGPIIVPTVIKWGRRKRGMLDP